MKKLNVLSSIMLFVLLLVYGIALFQGVATVETLSSQSSFIWAAVIITLFSGVYCYNLRKKQAVKTDETDTCFLGKIDELVDAIDEDTSITNASNIPSKNESKEQKEQLESITKKKTGKETELPSTTAVKTEKKVSKRRKKRLSKSHKNKK